MKIAIDARFYGEAGPGRYVKNLVERLARQDREHEYVIFLNPQGYNSFSPNNPRFKKVLVNCSWYSFKEQFVMLWFALRERPDVFHIPHFNIPILYPGKLVVTIHDLIIHEFSTERATTRYIWYYRLKRAVYRGVVGWACWRASTIIVPSQAVKNELLKEYSWLSEDKITVTYEGVDAVFLDKADKSALTKYNLSQPYLLCVGSFYPHKNTFLLARGLQVLKEKHSFSGQLVLVGKQDFFAERLQKELAEMDLDGQIIFPGLEGYVPDKDVAALLKSAAMYVFPSLKEGFSLTPLEAMVSRVPVVVSDIPAHREILGESALFFDPQSVEDLAEKVSQVLGNKELREKLVDRGLRQVEKYSWSRMVEQTRDVYGHFYL